MMVRRDRTEPKRSALAGSRRSQWRRAGGLVCFWALALVAQVAPPALGVPYAAASAADDSGCASIGAGEATIQDSSPLLGPTVGPFADVIPGVKPADNPAMNPSGRQDLHLMGYTLSGTAPGNGVPGTVTAVLKLRAPPAQHTGQASFYDINWKAGSAVHWVGVTLNDPEASALPSQYFGPAVHWEAGIIENGTTLAADSTQVSGSIHGSTITMSFAYGVHGNSQAQPSASGAQSYVMGIGFNLAVPVPIFLQQSPKSHNETLQPISTTPDRSNPGSLFGPGGTAFCGAGRQRPICDGAPALHDTSPPDGTVSCQPRRLTNYFDEHHLVAGAASQAVRLLADPVRHRIFEYYFAGGFGNCGEHPTNLVAYNTDSWEQVATGCVPIVSSCTDNEACVQASDLSDGVLFVTDNATASIVMVSEDSLREIARFDAVAAADPRTGSTGTGRAVIGASWYAPTNELLVLASESLAAGYRTFLASFQIKGRSVALDPLTGTAVPVWTTEIPQQDCKSALNGAFATGNPNRSILKPNRVYVPCVMPSLTGGNSARDGLATVELGSADAQGQPCPNAGLCPDGVVTAVAAPGLQASGLVNYLYDPGSDRSYIMWDDQQTGITVNTYDADTAAFLGRGSIGVAADYGFTPLGIDTLTGRIYGVGPHAGLTVVDGRRTPLAPGTQMPQFASNVVDALLPVIPPSAAHHFPRLLVSYAQGDPDPAVCRLVCRLPYWTVLADTLPVGADPKADLIDGHTYSGPIAASDQVFATYGGEARGFGVHSDFVGSFNKVLENNIGNATASAGNGNLPFGSGTRDILAGFVGQLNIGDGATQGAAAAVSAADNATADQLGSCTDVFVISTRCLPGASSSPIPNDPVATVLNSGLDQTGQSTQPRTTRQQWPFPEASCSEPGAADSPKACVQETPSACFSALIWRFSPTSARR